MLNTEQKTSLLAQQYGWVDPSTIRPVVRESSTYVAQQGIAEFAIHGHLASYAQLLADAHVPPEDIEKNCANIANLPSDLELVALRVDVMATIASPELQKRVRRVGATKWEDTQNITEMGEEIQQDISPHQL